MGGATGKKNNVSLSTVMIAASGWIVSIFVGVLSLPEKINSFFSEAPIAITSVTKWMFLDEELTGIWTSDLESWIDATNQERERSEQRGGPLTLRIRVYKGKLDGEIISEGLSSGYVHSIIMLEGFKEDNEIRTYAYDYMDGEKKIIGIFTFELDKSSDRFPVLFKLIEQGGPFFPDSAQLHKDSEAFERAMNKNASENFFYKFIQQRNRIEGREFVPDKAGQ